MHFSCFCTHPCFSFLCAGACNTRLYVKLSQNPSARAGLSALFFCAQGRQIRTFRLFDLPLLLSFVRRRGSYTTCVRTHDHVPTRRPLFAVCRRSEYVQLAFLDSRGHPRRPLGPHRGPLGVLTAPLNDPSLPSGAFPVPPGALCDHTGCSRRFP